MAQSWYAHLRGQTVPSRGAIDPSRNWPYFVDIMDVTLCLFFFARDYVDVLTGADCLYRRAGDQAALGTGTTSAIFCIGCKPLACCFASLVVHSRL